MITIEEYFGPWLDHADVTDQVRVDAQAMLDKVNVCLADAESAGAPVQINPNTGSCVSGQTYGGFRPQDCPIGAAHSSHKLGRAVDIYDPAGDLDSWLNDARLEQYGLYREAPASTRGWCHLSDKSPGSGIRTFQP